MRDAVDVAAEPVAWVDFAANGNVRLWTADWHRANRETKAGRAMQPLYTAEALRSASNSGALALRIATECLRSYADPAGYTDNYGDPYEPGDGHPGTLAAKALAEIAALPAPAPASPWRPIEEAPKDRTPVLARLKNHLADNRTDLDRWRGILVVVSHPGVCEDGFDIGWSMAAPVGHGGFPDDWFDGWMPLPSTDLPTPPASKDT